MHPLTKELFRRAKEQPIEFMGTERVVINNELADTLITDFLKSHDEELILKQFSNTDNAFWGIEKRREQALLLKQQTNAPVGKHEARLISAEDIDTAFGLEPENPIPTFKHGLNKAEKLAEMQSKDPETQSHHSANFSKETQSQEKVKIDTTLPIAVQVLIDEQASLKKRVEALENKHSVHWGDK